ncbi:hypothetical protein ACFL5G_02095 [Candidatus Margulisiibacteriota bacterium]
MFLNKKIIQNTELSEPIDIFNDGPPESLDLLDQVAQVAGVQSPDLSGAAQELSDISSDTAPGAEVPPENIPTVPDMEQVSVVNEEYKKKIDELIKKLVEIISKAEQNKKVILASSLKPVADKLDIDESNYNKLAIEKDKIDKVIREFGSYLKIKEVWVMRVINTIKAIIE